MAQFSALAALIIGGFAAAIWLLLRLETRLDRLRDDILDLRRGRQQTTRQCQ